MNPSRNHDNKARKEKVLVDDQLMWNKQSLASSEKNLDQTLAVLSVREKREVRKGVVLQNGAEWKTNRLERVFGHRMGWP